MQPRNVPPSASALISSMRGVGYSLETAIADIIDNSIAAEAKVIDIVFSRDGNKTKVYILDDGRGMSEAELVEAMRFGGAGPDKLRCPNDLGRFGLGLKTASLSQCRKLIVVSKKDHEISSFSWDVDFIKNSNGEWHLLDGLNDVEEQIVKKLDARNSGTAIIWQKVDFGGSDETREIKSVYEDLEKLERHLAMIFHRYLRGEAQKLVIKLNGNTIEGWDPFLEGNSYTAALPIENVRTKNGSITIRGFILPHKDRFIDEKEFYEAGGPEGWNAQQGFYLYRNKRLLCVAGWLGLGGSRKWTREEPSRLARIRVDIPNSADRDWRIDIRKAIARPPEQIRGRLTHIAEDARSRAREVFVHRGLFGARQKKSDVSRIWLVNKSSDSNKYHISRDHELIQILKRHLGSQSSSLEAVLDLIERTVPVDRIWLDITERGSEAETKTYEEEDLRAALKLIDIMTDTGMSYDLALQKVSSMEPFDQIKDFSQRLIIKSNKDEK